MIFVCLVISNVIVGLTVNRIDHFVKKGHLVRLQQTAKTIKSFKSPIVKFFAESKLSLGFKDVNKTIARIEVLKLDKITIKRLTYRTEQQCENLFEKNECVAAKVFFKISKETKNEAQNEAQNEKSKDIDIPTTAVVNAIKITQKEGK